MICSLNEIRLHFLASCSLFQVCSQTPGGMSGPKGSDAFATAVSLDFGAEGNGGWDGAGHGGFKAVALFSGTGCGAVACGWLTGGMVGVLTTVGGKTVVGGGTTVGGAIVAGGGTTVGGKTVVGGWTVRGTC